MKVCTHCHESKDESEFNARKALKDGLRSTCRTCDSVCRKGYKKATKEEQREYYRANRELMLDKQKRYAETHADIVRERRRRHRKANKTVLNHKQNEYYKERRKHDLQFKLKTGLRTRLNIAIKGAQKGGSAIRDLGCSMDEFKRYIESKFMPGMNWDNWGHGKGKWNLDHIVPLSWFDLTNAEQFKTAAHFTNYQPLWHFDNLSKKDRYVG